MCAPYILPLIFYWNAVRGRYLMFVTCTALMASSLIKNALDSDVLHRSPQGSPCRRRTSISVPAVTTVCFWHVLLDYEPLWFDSARRNVCTIIFAFVSFLLDCPFGNCMILSFILSYLLALTAIEFRCTLVEWYEMHLSKIWLCVAAVMICTLLVGFRPCYLTANGAHKFQGGISSVVRPLGSVLGLLVCDKLDEKASIRSHICGKGLSLSSWLINFMIGACFIFVDIKLALQSYIFSSIAISSLLVVYTIISCHMVPLFDLRLVEKENTKFIELLAAAINSCRESRQHSTVNTAQGKISSPCVDAAQKSFSKTTGDFTNGTGINDLEVADLMKVTSTNETEDAFNPNVTTKRILKTDTSGAKSVGAAMRFFGVQ
ncbi:uncharacterized protein LOC111271366 [Varroa jacobsoni]|nr:uncharacterized protein LOC111271366 [Varroa jacobsoni]